MFVPSNDLVFAFGDDGIALFDGDTAIDGDVSSDVAIWDVGSEVNQEPGVGLDQVQRQTAVNTGADEGATCKWPAMTSRIPLQAQSSK